MNTTIFIKDFVPVVGLIAIGYVFARHLQVATSSLRTLLRFAMFPALLFTLLVSRVEPTAFAMMAGIGIAVAVAGLFLVRVAPVVLKPTVDVSAAVPNLATFTLPFMALGWMSVGMGTAAALFVGVSVAVVAVRTGGDSRFFKALAGEPWVYAVAAAIGFLALELPTDVASHSVTPLATAAVPVLLLYLGASMFPLVGFKDSSAWATVGVRLVAGLAVAFAVIALVPMSREVKEALVIIAFAPPATTALAMAGPLHGAGNSGNSGNSSDDLMTTIYSGDVGQPAASLGTLVALAAMVSLELLSW